MEELVVFFTNYGLWITLIAIVGIAILGAMKYCKLFAKLEETNRHYIYLLISVGISVAGTAIYLVAIGAFEWNYFFAVAAAIYALNQAFYAIFKVTPVNKLFTKILDWVVILIKDKVVPFIKDKIMASANDKESGDIGNSNEKKE